MKYFKTSIISVLTLFNVAICGYSLNSCYNEPSEEVSKVIEMIDGLTTITLDSKDQLNAISSAYAELTKSEKEQVSNYDEYIDAKNIYEELVLEDETKDDPTRNIVLDDLIGTWDSKKYTWKISDFMGGESVLWYIYDKTTDSSGPVRFWETETVPSSYLTGYDVHDKRMNCKLCHTIGEGWNEFLDVSLVSGINSNLTMFYGSQTFTKTNNNSW